MRYDSVGARVQITSGVSGGGWSAGENASKRRRHFISLSPLYYVKIVIVALGSFLKRMYAGAR